MKTSLLLILLLSGCQTIPDMPKAPEIVRVEVLKYVPVPAELTGDCKNSAVQEQTYSEAKRLALVRGEYLDECTQRMRKIRSLKEPTP